MTVTVDYEERPTSPMESINYDGVAVTRILRCAWADRILLSKQLLGFTIEGVVNVPDKYDTGTDPLTNVYCTDVQINPILGLKSDTGSYQFAELHCTYTSVSYDVETLVTESLEPSVQYLTLGETDLWWDNSQTTRVLSDETPARLLFNLDWVYTKHNWSYEIPATIFDMAGTVNSASCYSRALDWTFDVGTLLAGSPSLTREVTSEGTTAWTITFRFTWQPETWHKFPRVGSNGDLTFVNIYDGTTPTGLVKQIYDTYNFNNWID